MMMRASINKRLCSLDVFRGFTVAAMMIVNNPGSWKHVSPSLLHVGWNGCNFADLIFPFFIWISGVAMAFSFAANDDLGNRALLKKIFKRALVLFAIGVFLNCFPLGFVRGDDFSWAAIKITGVLQRIAICYFVSSLIMMYGSVVWQAVWALILLAGYWVLLKVVPVPGFGAGVLEPLGNLVWYIDTKLIYVSVGTTDPEGILSTLPAIATMLLGVLTGHFLRSDKEDFSKSVWMLVFGIVFILLGTLINNWLPINKHLWTTSFVFFSVGFALVIFAYCYYFVDVLGHKKIFKPLQIMGLNALGLYVISILIIRFTAKAKVFVSGGDLVSVKQYYYEALFPATKSLEFNSFVHGVVFMLFMYLIAYAMYRRLGRKGL